MLLGERDARSALREISEDRVPSTSNPSFLSAKPPPSQRYSKKIREGVAFVDLVPMLITANPALYEDILSTRIRDLDGYVMVIEELWDIVEEAGGWDGVMDRKGDGHWYYFSKEVVTLGKKGDKIDTSMKVRSRSMPMPMPTPMPIPIAIALPIPMPFILVFCHFSYLLSPPPPPPTISSLSLIPSCAAQDTGAKL